MEIKRAAELLRGLADGVDPMTGRPLPDESVYNRPEIIRALHCVLRALQERADRTKKTLEEVKANANIPAMQRSEAIRRAADWVIEHSTIEEK